MSSITANFWAPDAGFIFADRTDVQNPTLFATFK
jgi:hypothetical protein